MISAIIAGIIAGLCIVSFLGGIGTMILIFWIVSVWYQNHILDTPIQKEQRKKATKDIADRKIVINERSQVGKFTDKLPHFRLQLRLRLVNIKGE